MTMSVFPVGVGTWHFYTLLQQRGKLLDPVVITSMISRKKTTFALLLQVMYAIECLHGHDRVSALDEKLQVCVTRIVVYKQGLMHTCIFRDESIYNCGHQVAMDDKHNASLRGGTGNRNCFCLYRKKPLNYT